MAQQVKNWRRSNDGSLTDFFKKLIEEGNYIQSITPMLNNLEKFKGHEIVDSTIILCEDNHGLINLK